LRGAGLATSAREGKMVMYELTDRGRSLLAAVSTGARVVV
jgi:DNA-binding transcriptional ArsR family regulator